jgi:hypothetical protein
VNNIFYGVVPLNRESCLVLVGTRFHIPMPTVNTDESRETNEWTERLSVFGPGPWPAIQIYNPTLINFVSILNPLESWFMTSHLTFIFLPSAPPLPTERIRMPFSDLIHPVIVNSCTSVTYIIRSHFSHITYGRRDFGWR